MGGAGKAPSIAAPLAAAAALTLGALALRPLGNGRAVPALLGAGAVMLAGKSVTSAGVQN